MRRRPPRRIWPHVLASFVLVTGFITGAVIIGAVQFGAWLTLGIWAVALPLMLRQQFCASCRRFAMPIVGRHCMVCLSDGTSGHKAEWQRARGRRSLKCRVDRTISG